MEELKQLSLWDIDTKEDFKRWERVKVPDLTADNMGIYFDKINELVSRVNELTAVINQLTNTYNPDQTPNE